MIGRAGHWIAGLSRNIWHSGLKLWFYSTINFKRLVFNEIWSFQWNSFRSSMIFRYDINLATLKLIFIEWTIGCGNNLTNRFFEWWSNTVLSAAPQKCGEILEKYEKNSGEIWAEEILEEGPRDSQATASDKQAKLKMETLESTEENIIRHAIRCNWEDLQ